MPLGNVLGEFTAKILSIRQSDLGGGQVRVEIDVAGEGTEQGLGQVISTMVMTVGAPSRPSPFTGTGTLLAASGAVVRWSSWGVRIRTGEGHKVRCRGAACYTTDDPTLAFFNSIIAATEFEVDPATMTMQGMVCEWQ